MYHLVVKQFKQGLKNRSVMITLTSIEKIKKCVICAKLRGLAISQDGCCENGIMNFVVACIEKGALLQHHRHP